MPIVVLTRKNFTSTIKDKIDDLGSGAFGIFASSLLGGSDKLKEEISALPEEQKIYVDTKYVMSATSLMKVEETGEVFFQITLSSPLNDNQNTINIKGEEYEDFIRVWAGEREYIGPGTYKVGFGQDCDTPWAKTVSPRMWAEVSEDGLTVTVREEKFV